jgi:homoserine O-acetyltransferase
VRIDPALFQENERLTTDADERRYLEVGALECEAGGSLPSVTVAYETWGELSQDADNAVLICHALSGDSHAVGWWDRLVGPGKPIDTGRFFVIGSNALGGCRGTTGPNSAAPDGKPYRTRFPIVTVGDMVEVQRRLVESLGIERLHAVAGGSMGGMQALEWTLRFPGRAKKAFVAASCAAHNAMQIGFNEVSRQAIMRDPRWQSGEYQAGNGPDGGLCVARMLGHLTYLSDASFETKFARRLQDKEAPDYRLGVEYAVESYLAHQGEKFTTRFDANSLLYLTRAIDYFDRRSFAGSRSEYLFTSFTSDWIYPSRQSEEMHGLALEAGCASQWSEIDLPFGHDAFLLDGEFQGALVRRFLER